MNFVATIETLALFSALATLAWLLAPRARTQLTPGLILLVLLLGVQAIVHLSDVIEWLGFLETDQVGDDLRVVVPLLWLISIFALHRHEMSGALDQEKEQVEFFLAETPLAAVVLDADGIVLSASRDFAEKMRVSREELAGKALATFPGAPIQLLEKVLPAAKEPNGPLFSSEPLQIVWGGKREWVEWHAKVRSLASSNARRITLVVRVVTEQLEKELQERREARELFETHRAELVGQLAATVVHDLNNFLHAISSNAELLPEDSSDPEIAEARAAILEGSKTATALVRSLAGLARAKGASENVDLVDLVRATSSLIQRSMPLSIQLELVLPKAPLPIVGDRGRLQQALVNLIINARDAMPNGGLLRIEVIDHGSIARLSIQDSGMGIPRELLQRIFERFFTTKAAANGTGLGLALVRSVVDEHNGAVEVDSTLNVGTTFRLTLPKVRAIEQRAH